jgi:hypothetical protein
MVDDRDKRFLLHALVSLINAEHCEFNVHKLLRMPRILVFGCNIVKGVLEASNKRYHSMPCKHPDREDD